MRVLAGGVADPPGRWAVTYPYRSLYALDMGSGTVEPIAGAAAAKRYFAAHPLARAVTCPFDYGVGNPLH